LHAPQHKKACPFGLMPFRLSFIEICASSFVIDLTFGLHHSSFKLMPLREIYAKEKNRNSHSNE
ncbi:hypothetical protein ACFL02_09100, partial [Planctomycetota bacterium]